ncbi:MAG TPA: hypothetical protein VI685_20720 [Candidatus Angelobacter sp.]
MFLVFLLLAYTWGGEHSTGAIKQTPQAVALIEQARALAPEFGADSLLRLANSTLIVGDEAKSKLIAEAFWAGERAFLPYKQWADRMDSLPTRAVRANRLEALTLQTRAVQAMLPLNPQKALQMFEKIHSPVLPDLSCSDDLTPDVSDYYQAAGAVFAQAFTPRQRKAEEDMDFLKQQITGLSSPSQVAPALQMVLILNVSPEQRNTLLTAFAGSLDRISGSDRSFGSWEGALAPEASPDIAAAPAFVAALRAYIVRHVHGRRCSDNVPPDGKPAKSVVQFNALLESLGLASEHLKPISETEASPLSKDGSSTHHLLWRSSKSRSILSELQWLHHGNIKDGSAQPSTLKLADRQTDEWLDHYQNTLKLMQDWKEQDEETPEDYFCMATDALSDLAALAPPGKVRDRAMNAYLEFLELHYPAIENRNLWFTQFRQMLYRARFSKDAEDKAWILNSMSRSANPVIALYAKLEILGVAP